MTTLPTLDMDGVARRSRFASLITLGCFLALGVLLAGCGNDDDDNNSSNAQTLNSELAGLEGFGRELATGTPAQVVGSPQASDLLAQFGLALGVAREGSRLVPLDFDAITRKHPIATRNTRAPGIALTQGGIPYGTYERDAETATEPFPGWTFVSSDPTDGFVFHFSQDDDFVVIENGAEHHISGEIRFLHVVFEPVGTELIVTSMIWELSIDPIPVPVIHVPFSGSLAEGTSDYDIVDFGDVTQPNDLANCYFGTLAFDFHHDEHDSTNVATTLLAVDPTQDPDYVLRLDLDQLNISQEVPQEVAFHFGFGHSNDASNQAVDVTADFTNFTYDPNTDDYLADVTGNITHRDREIATFAGNTRTVQLEVDITGDGQVTADDSCVDINITFTDSGQTQNLCVALQGFAQSLPLIPDGSGGSLRFGPLSF
jgi:hypothetical protein